MEFVIDENVSLGLAAKLRSRGYKVLSIAEEPERGQEDEEIFSLCINAKSVLITRDYHFTNPIRFPVQKTGGIIYIRHGNLRSEEEIELVERFLMEHPLPSFAGKLISLSKGGLKIR